MNNVQFTMYNDFRKNKLCRDRCLHRSDCGVYGAITIGNRSIATISMNQFVRYAEIRDFRFVFDKCGPMWASVPTLG